MSENGWKAFSVLWVRAEVKIASTQQRPADLARHSESNRSAFPNLRSNGDSGLRLCGRYLRKLSAIWRSSPADRNVSLGSVSPVRPRTEWVCSSSKSVRDKSILVLQVRANNSHSPLRSARPKRAQYTEPCRPWKIERQRKRAQAMERPLRVSASFSESVGIIREKDAPSPG